MAETAITAVLSKLGELASREAAVLLQVGNDIMLLRDRLEWLQAFIRDADRKRRLGADDLTCVWVRQTRDVAFEAEDALDDFFHKVRLLLVCTEVFFTFYLLQGDNQCSSFFNNIKLSISPQHARKQNGYSFQYKASLKAFSKKKRHQMLHKEGCAQLDNNIGRFSQICF